MLSCSEHPLDPGEKLANATFTAKSVQLDAFRAVTVLPGVFQTPSDCSYRSAQTVKYFLTSVKIFLASIQIFFAGPTTWCRSSWVARWRAWW